MKIYINKKTIFLSLFFNALWLSYSFSKTTPFYLITDDKPKQKIPISYEETITTTPANKERGINFELYLKDKTPIQIEFFDRKSKTLLIIGQGIPDIKETGRKAARLFKEYDVVLFDYRWHNSNDFFLKPSTLISPIKKTLYEETEEVLTVVNFFKAIKKYDKVIGLGLCYSGFTFIASQLEEQLKGKQLFSKLIIDSCWWSVLDFQKQIASDPYLPCNPRNGGAPDCLKNFLNNKIVNAITSFFLKLITPDICIEKNLSELENVPVLFIHGKNDLMVPLKTTFNLIFDSTKKVYKSVLVTPFQHGINLQNPEMYKKICDLFIESKDHDEFIQSIKGLENKEILK